MTKVSSPYKGNSLLDKRPDRPLTAEELQERILALLEHYGINEPKDDPKTADKLALSLAEAHVPGLQPIRKRGRPKRRTPVDVAAFLFDFIHAQVQSGTAPRQTTLKQMSKDPWWVENGFESSKEGVLQAMRHEMQELMKPGAFREAINGINALSLEYFEWLRKNPEEQRDIRDKLGQRLSRVAQNREYA